MKNKIAAVVLAAASGLSLVGCQSLSQKIEFGLGIKVNTFTAAAAPTVNVTAVAAAFDLDGKVLGADIDVYQVPYKVVEGVLTLDNTKKQTMNAGALVVESKKELGEDYAMSTVEGLEWFEQAEKLEEYFVGKTVAELKGLVSEDHLPAAISGAEVSAETRISIKVTDYVAALEEAYELKKSQETKAGKGDEVKVGVAGHVVSKATGFDIIFGSAAVDSEETVVGAMIDTVQIALAVSGDAGAEVIGFNTTNKGYNGTATDGDVWKTKYNLGDAYGMKTNSGIEKEWWQQADALTVAVIGMTADEIEAIDLDEEGVVTDEELLTSVTIGVDDYIAVWAKAIGLAD